MFKYVIIITLLLAMTCEDSFAQRRRSGRWKQSRYEFVFGIGGTGFLGELGGRDQIGTNSIRDLEISLTRPLFSVGLRYKIEEYIAVKGALAYGKLRGDDNKTAEIFRNNRNLSFRSPIVEFSLLAEYSFIKERVGHKYNLRKIRGVKGFKTNTYFFTGIGVFYFNPRAQYNGKWYSLAPLSTEGQGLVPTRKKYSRVQISIPIGIGMKYSLNRKLSIGLEYGVRKTFTDYIDDVSTTYYDKELLREAKGDVAAELSDPSLRQDGWTGANAQRGDSFNKDAYMFLQISICYKMRTSRGGMPKF